MHGQDFTFDDRKTTKDVPSVLPDTVLVVLRLGMAVLHLGGWCFPCIWRFDLIDIWLMSANVIGKYFPDRMSRFSGRLGHLILATNHS